MTPYAPRRHRPRLRAAHAVPPLHPADAAEGADLLAELPCAAGVLLWGALRDFTLWTETPYALRGSLFDPGAGEVRRDGLMRAGVDPELWTPLLTLAQMTDAPLAADRGRLVYALRSVARWAERSGAPATRLAFTQAAAVALPDQPGLALEAGKLARDLGRTAQAEGWLRAAVRRARGLEWETYAWAFVALGVLYVRAGNYPAAQAVFGRALRRARKHRFRPIEASSLHHLFTCAAERGDVGVAYRFAREALAAYGPRNPLIPRLANDVARLWMDLGRADRALPVFAALVPHLSEEHWRVITLANLTLAAARVGDRARYEEARARTLAEVAGLAGARVADVWNVVAAADAAAGEWARVEHAAGRASRLAEARGEAEALFTAGALLEAARSRAEVPAARRAEPAVSAAHGHHLAGELLVRIGELDPAAA